MNRVYEITLIDGTTLYKESSKVYDYDNTFLNFYALIKYDLDRPSTWRHMVYSSILLDNVLEITSTTYKIQ